MSLKAHAMRTVHLLFRDERDRIVVWQPPNIPIVGWIVFMLLARLATDSDLGTAFGHISTAFLFTWGYLELFQGVNYFRRLLGLVMLLITIASIILR